MADSNIYISALVFGGTALQFLDAARSGTFQLAISDALLAEVTRVLATKFRWMPEAVEEAAALINEIAERVTPSVSLSVVKDDPDDDRVIECAATANAQFIVTGNQDLLRLGGYEAITILRVADFMGLIRAR